MKKILLSVLILLFFATGCTSAAKDPGENSSIYLTAMDTVMKLTAYGPHRQEALEQAQEERFEVVHRMLGFGVCFFVLFFCVSGIRSAHDSIDHEEVAEEAYARGHLDVLCVEDSRVEGVFVGTAARHEYHAHDDDGHADGQENEIDAVEGKHLFLSFGHIVVLW